MLVKLKLNIVGNIHSLTPYLTESKYGLLLWFCKMHKSFLFHIACVAPMASGILNMIRDTPYLGRNSGPSHVVKSEVDKVALLSMSSE